MPLQASAEEVNAAFAAKQAKEEARAAKRAEKAAAEDSDPSSSADKVRQPPPTSCA